MVFLDETAAAFPGVMWTVVVSLPVSGLRWIDQCWVTLGLELWCAEKSGNTKNNFMLGMAGEAPRASWCFLGPAACVLSRRYEEESVFSLPPCYPPAMALWPSCPWGALLSASSPPDPAWPRGLDLLCFLSADSGLRPSPPVFKLFLPVVWILFFTFFFLFL